MVIKTVPEKTVGKINGATTIGGNKTEVKQHLRSQWQQLEARFRVLEDPATSNLIVSQGVDVLVQATGKLDALLAELQAGQWPEPTVAQPAWETLEDWMWDGCCEATDGCIIEPDGHCPHGHPSWLLVLGLV